MSIKGSGTKLEFILNELKKIEHKEKNGRIYVKCPYHDDSSPSFTINIDPSKPVPLGWGKCWACPASVGWNDHSLKLGMKPLSKSALANEVVYARPKKLQKNKLMNTSSGMTIDELLNALGCGLAEPINENWRGYSAEYLKTFGMLVAVDKFDNQVMIVPVLVNKELCGGVIARWKKHKSKKIPSYINMSGQWINSRGLFPYDHVSNMLDDSESNYVVIVEGLRDALRLNKEGIPTLCIFGTQTWTDDKLEVIKALGVTKIFIGMDTGSAGISSANKIARLCKGKIERIIIPMAKYQKRYEERYGKLDEELDMHNAPDKIIKWIKRLIKGNT